MRKLLYFLKPYLAQVITGPVFKFTEAVLELFVPVVMAQIIDNGVANSDKSYIISRGLLLVLLGAVGLGCAAVCQYYASKTSQAVGTDLRNALFTHIQSLSQSQVEKLGQSNLTTALTSDTNQLQSCVAMLMRLVVRAPFIVIGAFASALFIDVKLSMIMLAAIPVLALMIYLVMKNTVPFYRRIRSSLDKVSGILRENLTGVRVVRAFNRQSHEISRFDSATDELSDTTSNSVKLSSLLNPLTYVIVNLVIALIIYAGGYHVDGGYLTQGELVAFVNYMLQINTALVVVANLVVTFTRGSASAERVNRIFAEKPEITDGNIDVKAVNSDYAIEMNDVSFSYGGSDVLENINLKIKKGEHIGIIGGTGDGKSTLAKLIVRLIDAKSGEVKVNGINVKDCTIDSLRKTVVYIPQKAQLISGTVADNVKMGKEDATGEQILTSLKNAQADFVLESAEGFSMKILQQGKNLSGGQKQRISIARGLCVDGEVFIFDDCTSALDVATAGKISLYIKSMDKTVITITQRPDIIADYERIIVIEDGKLACDGNCAYLYENCAFFRETVDSMVK